MHNTTHFSIMNPMREHQDSPTKMHSMLSMIQEYGIYGLLIISALFFLPFTTSYFDSTKVLAVSVFSVLSLLLWAWMQVVQKKVVIVTHPLTLPLILYFFAIIASALFGTKPFTDSLSKSSLLLLGLIVASLFSIQVLKIRNNVKFLNVLIGISLILTLIGITQYGGVGPSLLLNAMGLQVPNTFLFTLSGSPLISLGIFIVTAVATIVSLVTHWKSKKNIFHLMGLGVIVLSILFHVFMMRPGQPYQPLFMPFWANWMIATDVLKNAKTAFFGFGPEGFSAASNIFRPIQLNATPLWNITNDVGFNTPLSYLVTLGLFGFVAWVLLFAKSLLLFRRTPRDVWPVASIVVTSLVIQLFLPLNMMLAIIQFTAITFWISILKSESHSQISETSLNILATRMKNNEQSMRTVSVFSYLSVFLALLLSGVIIWFTQMVYRADAYYFASLKAVERKDGEQAYLLQQKAIQTNPYKDEYHRAFAQTNFLIAQNLSTQKDLADEQKKLMEQLLQQALQESRVATQLNPLLSQNWLTMASLYNQLIGGIEKADQWAIASYVKAIETNPNAPLLRVSLGNLFYQAENYGQAAQIFSQASQLKPDLPTPYYNLAKSLEMIGNLDQSIAAYQKLLSLLDSQSETYMQVEKELNKVLEKAKKNKEEQAKAAETSKQPEEAELPKEVKDDAQILEQESALNIDQSLASPSGNVQQ